MIKIMHANGIRYDAPLVKGAKCVCKLMEEDYILLPFSTLEKVHFGIGDFVDLSDEQYDNLGLFGSARKKYVVTEKQVPTPNQTTGGFDWSLKLNAYYWAWNNRIFKFRPLDCAQEATWGYTANVGKFLELFCDNLSAYSFGDFGFVVDEEISNYNINLSFEATKMTDALKMICDKVVEEYKVECEWWVIGNTIYLGKCEQSQTIDITENDTQSIAPSDSDVEYANRLIVFGGSQNISARYRKKLYFTADEVIKEDGNVKILDKSKTEFSVSMFPVASREVKETLSFNADTNHGGGSEWIEDYKWDRHENIKQIGIYNASSPSLSIDVNIDVEMKNALYTQNNIGLLDGQSSPDKPDTELEPSYLFKIYFAEVELYMEKGAKRISIASKTFEAKSLPQYLESVNLSIFGEQIVTIPNFGTDGLGEWKIMLRSNFLYDTTQPETQEYWNRIPFATFETRFEAVFKQAFVYRVNTSILFPKTGKQYPCTINEDYATISTEEGRVITIHTDEDVVDVGDVFTFPNIVLGKVPSGYFSANMEDTLVNAIVQKNLMLPQSFGIDYNADGTISKGNGVTYNGKNYIDLEPNLSPEQIVEAKVVYDEIYPKQNLVVGATGFYTHDTEEEDSTGFDTGIKGGILTKTHYFWQFIVDGLDFNEDCLIEGVELGVKFNTGKLAGLSFKVAWKPTNDTIGTGDDSHRWEVVNNTDYGIELPNSLIHPESGDEIILTGWNSEALEDNTLITDAEEALLDEAIKQANIIKQDPHTYQLSLMSDFVADYPCRDFPLMLGTRLDLHNDYLFNQNHREVRLIGYEFCLDIPYDTPQLIAGEKFWKSNSRNARERLNAIENKNLKATPLVIK